MERSVMFLQSLLMLVVAIQVISACSSGPPLTMEQAICVGITVVMAAPVSAELTSENGTPVPKGTLATHTKYNMYMHVLYRHGWIPMKESESFVLFTPRETNDDGVVLEIGEEYYISGDMQWDGSLYTTSCDFVQRVPWFNIPIEHSRANNDLLTGQRTPDCEKFKRTGRVLV